ncbi:Hypothetical protein IALB_1223 [Ignavibacterium album JCM 16511]|uniref:Uncharacterized protein n=1 Tax=Ignavibacterium album (strain DSM 19864 / JCM 16511 / NBRC 101810 / Mat9-16) TaxID=945713 RepID=I0AIX7_IGNAJ|nr:Hypothetical protein IALB_1223 [Ignavibacterium album JCM 16511]
MEAGHIASQFHYGSIKTKLFQLQQAIPEICLNSTMVRLKRLYGKPNKYKIVIVSIPLWFD